LKIAFLTTDNREHHRRYEMTDPYFGTAPEALLQGFSTTPEVEVHVVSCTQRPMKSPAKLADNIWFHSLVVPKIGWLRTGYQGCIRATRKFLRELRPDIVHGQGTERDSAISAVFSGFPNVITIHGNMRLIAKINGAWPFSFAWLAARLEAFTIPRSDGVVCITHYTQNAVKGVARKKWVVPNAVDASFFEVERKRDPIPLLLCVGTICRRKNQNAFIQALDPLAQVREFQLLFLGNGADGDPYVTEFRRLVRARKWCQFEGFTGREALRTWFSRAHLLALPSLEDNCPMSVIEAAAAAVPVVAANVGGVPDLIEDGVTGLLCDPANASSMAGCVERILSSDDLAAKISRAARERGRQRFHPGLVAEQHIEIYRELATTSA
jgi:glycosyltransferase involved in cell wall biosynthesis